MTPRHRCHAADSRLLNAPVATRHTPCARSLPRHRADAVHSSANRPVEGSPSSPLRLGHSARLRFLLSTTEGPLSNPTRLRARVVPSNPITVAIDDECGLPLGYGVIANMPMRVGVFGRIATWKPGARLSLRVSFPHPAEVHEAAALVVWGDEGEDPAGTGCTATACAGTTLRLPACGACARSRSALGTRPAHAHPGHETCPPARARQLRPVGSRRIRPPDLS